MSRNKIPYLDNKDLMVEWEHWKETGVISERMGQQMLLLARHVMESRQFNRYRQHMKDDMVSDGVAKIITNLKNFNPEKGSIFSYWTRCVFTSSIDYLAKHYREMNKKRQLLLDALEKAETNMPFSQAKADLVRELERQIGLYSEKKEKEEEENK